MCCVVLYCVLLCYLFLLSRFFQQGDVRILSLCRHRYYISSYIITYHIYHCYISVYIIVIYLYISFPILPLLSFMQFICRPASFLLSSPPHLFSLVLILQLFISLKMALACPRDLGVLQHVNIVALSYWVGALKPSYNCKGLLSIPGICGTPSARRARLTQLYSAFLVLLLLG